MLLRPNVTHWVTVCCEIFSVRRHGWRQAELVAGDVMIFRVSMLDSKRTLSWQFSPTSRYVENPGRLDLVREAVRPWPPIQIGLTARRLIEGYGDQMTGLMPWKAVTQNEFAISSTRYRGPTQ